MYAVIETGGKQYRVEVGTELEVELLDAEPGEAVNLDRILLVADGETAAIGRPVVENASVAAEIVRRDRGEKLISFKYRPKARRRVKKGHRQELMILRINDIVLDGKSAAAEKAEVDKARKAEREKVEETAKRQAAADAALAAKLAADKQATADKAKAADTKARKGKAEAKTAAPEPAKAASTKAASTKAGAAPKTSKPSAKASATKDSTTKADAKQPAKKRSTSTKQKDG